MVEYLPLFHPIFHVSMGWDQEKTLTEAQNALNLFYEAHLQGCPNFEKLILSGDLAPAGIFIETGLRYFRTGNGKASSECMNPGRVKSRSTECR